MARRNKHKAASLKEWAALVKERDVKCVVCGSASDLEAHHIVPKSIDGKFTLSLSNGVTLCSGCHRKAHGIPAEGLLRLMVSDRGKRKPKYSEADNLRVGRMAYRAKSHGLKWSAITVEAKHLSGPSGQGQVAALAKAYAQDNGLEWPVNGGRKPRKHTPHQNCMTQ